MASGGAHSAQMRYDSPYKKGALLLVCPFVRLSVCPPVPCLTLTASNEGHTTRTNVTFDRQNSVFWPATVKQIVYSGMHGVTRCATFSESWIAPWTLNFPLHWRRLVLQLGYYCLCTEASIRHTDNDLCSSPRPNFVPSGGSFALPFGCIYHGTTKGDSGDHVTQLLRYDTTRNANV